MRNGISLHPMCLPGILPPIQLPHMRMGFGVGNGSLHMNSTGTLVRQETPTLNVFNLTNQRNSSNQLQLPYMSNIINSETEFGLGASIQANFGPFQHGTASGVSLKEPLLLVTMHAKLMNGISQYNLVLQCEGN